MAKKKEKHIQSIPDKPKGARKIKQDQWSEKYLKDYILERKKEAKDASKLRRDAWRELWNLYQNKQDFSKKQKWQSKVSAPKLWMKVERAASVVKQAVVQTSKLFKLDLDESKDIPDKLKEEFLEAMADIEKKFKRELDKTNFANVYGEMTKEVTLLGLGVPKVLWDEGSKRANYENIDPLNVYIDPSYKPNQPYPPGYIVEVKEIELSDLRLLAKKSSQFNTKKINEIEEEFKKVDEDMRKIERMGLSQYSKKGKKVQIDEFWGDVISEDGKEVKKNQLIMLANEKHIIRSQDNPFDHGVPPYILTYMLNYPRRGLAGQSLVEHMAGLQYLYNNVYNLYMDNLNFSVNKVFEYNPLSLDNPQSLTKIYPGKMIAKNTTEPVLNEVYTSQVGKEALAALESIGKEMQEATAVTEFIEGQPSRKAKTLGEVEIKTAESHGMFDMIARDLEANSIKPLLEMTYSLYVQFSGFESIEGTFLFKVGGLSLLMMQKQQIEHSREVLMFALQSPDLKQRTDIDDLWRKFLGIYNLQDVYKEPDPNYLDPEQAAQMQQRAEGDAKERVAQMSDEEIMNSQGVS